MTAKDPDEVEFLIEALREDLPSASDRDRVRARLLAAGVAVAGAAAVSSAAVANASSTAAGTATGTAAFAKSTKLTLGAKLASLSVAQKVGLAAALTVAGSAVPVVPRLMEEAREPRMERAVAARASAGVRASGSGRASGSVRASGSASVPGASAASEAVAVSTPSAPSVVIQPVAADGMGKGAVTAAPAAPVATRVVAGRQGQIRNQNQNQNQNQIPSPNQIQNQSQIPSPNQIPSPSPNPTPIPTVESGSVAVSATVASTLREETELLERAFAAIASRDLPAARSYLAQHAQRFPNGLLARERVRALARVARASQTQPGHSTKGANEP